MSQSIADIMTRAAIAASAEIMDVYARPIHAEHKSDGSPVTEADARAEAAILGILAETGLPVLAEESVSAGRVPSLGERFFVVDPLDGTKEFLKRNGEFTVNIALVEHGRPTHGVVLAPVTGALYIGGPDGASRSDLVDGRPSAATPLRVSDDGPLRIVASRSHGHAALHQLCDALAVEADVSVGSSLKFCLLAEGQARLYPRFTPTSKWDTAAGQAVLEAAGGVVLTLDGEPLRYSDLSAPFLNPFFVAATSVPLARRAASVMASLLTPPV
ncbi:3'(2'),5'-bisphosphate nucleotidase [Arsenicitalea aurantiaca]|uniref:3'(2'),5'-bisphosphate nucleotidase CysQ n=1 Tax=Arsenicitalea aurantiaca TaxID=1783274 RepID=A0A433X3I7_9HYPH|nr:3'(2'),5'-bisphosphate nucleotidase CysQ [Arsenicitalea aurantiaca]RUT28622.1 3'(2'),5'-bisphosphate nucleotidase [Arsenicitalea aurantiaca]